MKLFQQLLAASNTPPPKPKRKEVKRPKKPEAIAKHKDSRRRNRNLKWTEAFKTIGETATTLDLCAYFNREQTSINATIYRMLREETPPPIEIVGTINTSGNGHDRYVYRWLWKDDHESC